MGTFKDIRFTIIDDYAGMRHLIASLLKTNNAGNITQYQGAKQALSNIENGFTDFLICDFNMPEMTGLELVREIRQQKRLDHVAILMVTAEADRDSILSFSDLNIDGYILKPFNAQTLITKVIKIAENKNLIQKDIIKFIAKNKLPSPESSNSATDEATIGLNSSIDIVRMEGNKMKTLKDVRFLIADDYAGMRHLIATLLKNSGANTINHAQNGKQAYAYLANGHVDFLICDYNMPEMNGLELVKTIRSHQRFANIAILMVTAESEHDSVVDFAMLGVDGYIVKPFKAISLISKISEIAAKKHLIDTSLLSFVNHKESDKPKTTKIAGLDIEVEEFDI